jgi:CheY-like chemotaxis protein
MKKGFGILLVLLLMALQPISPALPQNQPPVEQLKTRLSKASGKEKIDALGTNAPRQVIQYGQQALTLLEKSPDPSLELGILNDICWNYHILGDYKKALASANKGIKIAEDLGLKDELSSFYNKKEPAVKERVNILFMDDDETVIAINQEMLHKMKFEVTCFKEGTEAVNAYKQAKTTNNPFDIVILDIINHIGMGGKEALQQLIEFDPGVKSIAISGFLRDTDINDLKKCGFNQVLLKPYTPTQLQTVINKALVI